MRRSRPSGFTLLEIMITLAIVGLLAALAVFGVASALRATRNAGARFEVVSLLSTAKQRAVARGTDVYVIFSNVESASFWPPDSAARVLLFEDADQTLRATPDALMAGLGAGRILDQLSGAGSTFAANGLTFVDGKKTVISGAGCDATAGAVPPYMSVTGDRLNSRACATAWCTFCEVQAGQCIGAVRFMPNGQARVVTGPDVGTGGLIKLVNPLAPERSACIAITEPGGYALAF